jgi:hypothetical protein
MTGLLVTLMFDDTTKLVVGKCGEKEKSAE